MNITDETADRFVRELAAQTGEITVIDALNAAAGAVVTLSTAAGSR